METKTVAIQGIFCFPNGIVSLLLDERDGKPEIRAEANVNEFSIDGYPVKLDSLIKWFVDAKRVNATIQIGAGGYDTAIHKADFTKAWEGS